jgi:two-component system sensor histidine kinase KdpD
MSDEPSRPDPDALLRRAQRESERQSRGKLRVFFGFAPGVGKTFRMLQVARELVSTQRLDVVVGVVETHRRYDTASLVLGLELLPRREVEHRGRALSEFDLDAALARKPQVLLVDELAHSNAPGSRHPKRWQDVEELLDAGIDVFTTLNVQHVESLNDVVAQITRVSVRETVPDAVLDRADSIELVDISPDELLERLKEGKVYLGEQAQRAADHFFRRGNLLALRELALRRTAQRVDDDVLEYRAQHGVSAPWPSGERILVAVGPAPSSDRLIRAAARMAAGLRCPWVAAYVDSPVATTNADTERLEAHLRLAESLGATVSRLSGATVADALLTFASKQNVTRIVLGKPTHSWLRDRLRGSMLDAVVRGSGAIDVHVIRGDDGVASSRARASVRAGARANPGDYLRAAGVVVLALAVSALLRATVNLPDPEMLFLLAVMVCAALFGRGPSLLAAGLGVACYDFFFVPPYFTLSVSDRRYVLTFAMMFAVGFVMSELVARLRRQERDATAREERTNALYALTRELASIDEGTAVCRAAVRHAATLFDARAVVLRADADGSLRAVAASPDDASLDAKEEGVARWSQDHGAPAGLGTDTLPGARSLCAPLRVGPNSLGVLALLLREPTPLRAEQRAVLDVFCRQVAAALDRVRLAELARQAEVKAEAEAMRSSLLSTVSHDLRTPLATITGAATTLRDAEGVSAGDQRELVRSICDESDRLERLVSNLLEMTRLDSGYVALARDWIPVDELVGAALQRTERRLAGRDVRVSVEPGASWVFVDPVLFEQVFVNLLENAVKYTPPESTIELRARAEPPGVTFEVIDHGEGIPAGDEERVFEKFYRGAHEGVSGAGLGLPICRAIVAAHGGAIDVRRAPEGGAAFRVRLPVTGRPPTLSEDAP